MNKKGFESWTGFLILILILVGGWLIINNVYIHYHKEKITNGDFYCENNVVKQKMGGLIGQASTMITAMDCMQYINSKYKIVCENNESYIICSTTIYSRYFAKEKEYDWITG